MADQEEQFLLRTWKVIREKLYKTHTGSHTASELISKAQLAL